MSSLEGQDEAQASQRDCPHLLVLSDAHRSLAEAAQVIHQRSSPTGGDTSAPTTFLLDADGRVLWLFRPGRHIERISAADLLKAVEERVK